MCDRVVSKELFMILYCPDEYKTQRMWDFCMSKDEKKETEPILWSNAFNVYNLRVLEHFFS